MGMMWSQMGQELSAMIESVFGGHAHVDPAANKVQYTPPQNGVGGMAGGVVRAGSFRLIPVEDNPTPASSVGLEIGAGVVPIADPAVRLLTGTTVTGAPASRSGAAVQLGLDLAPFALEARAAVLEARVARLAEEGTSTSVSLAFKPKLGPGHNMVGVNVGEGTEWSHLVVDDAQTSSGVVVDGKSYVVAANPPGPQYSVVEVPVKADQAWAAKALADSQVGGQHGKYQLFCNDCTTYAGDVLAAADVATPPISTPGINFASVVAQSPRVVGPLRTAAKTAAVASTVERATALEEELQMSVADEHPYTATP
jgi:hypothetical protein